MNFVERAKITVATMGSAVINGGFSTFLAFVLLATSNSYVFITFFKVKYNEPKLLEKIQKPCKDCPPSEHKRTTPL